MTDLAPTLALAHGATIPRLGLGSWPLVGDEAQRILRHGLAVGYRMIDTAEQYRNEHAVAAAVRASGVAREDVFIVSKFNAQWHGIELVQQAFQASAARLGVDYLDLFLIHWPNPWLDRYVEAWKGLLKLRDRGSVRAIGTSNFKPTHIERLHSETGEVPEINQIQLDPTLARAQTRAYHAARGIVTAAWSPLGRGSGLLDEPVITELARWYAKSPAQIVLRWHMELGNVAIPRSANPARIAENINILDFRLTAEEVASVSALDRGEAAARDSDRVGH